MSPRKRSSGGKHGGPPVEQVLTLAKILDTPDPKEQVARAQQLRMLATAPVFTLVIQVDSRGPENNVWVSNVGPAIPQTVAHMMLAAATKQLAETQARQEQAKMQQAAAPKGKKG